MLKLLNKRASFYADYRTECVSIPERPDIEAIISIPHETVYRNVSADAHANVIRLVRDLDEPLGFQMVRLTLL